MTMAATATATTDAQNVTSRLQFRLPAPDDIERCHEIEAASYPADEAASLDSLRYRQREANDYFQLCLLLDEKGIEPKIVGFVCGTRCDQFVEKSMSTHFPSGKFLAIHSVVVDEAFRRHGIATTMLQRYVQSVKEEAKQQQQQQQQIPVESIVLLAKQHLLGFYVQCGFRVNRPSPIVHGQDTWFELQQDVPIEGSVRSLPRPDETWFYKTERFKKPFTEVKPFLDEHKEWVRDLRDNKNVCITSGYRVDEQGKSGGGGLMFLAATSYEVAMGTVRQDPLVRNDCVEWELNGWIGQVGDLQMR